MQDGIHEAVWIYFVVLIIVGAFFAVNLALAVLYLQFTQSQAELEVEKEQERVQQERTHAPSIRASLLNSNPDGWWAKLQDRCFDLQESFWFEFTTMSLIGANTVVMASEYYGMSNAHLQVSSLRHLQMPALRTKADPLGLECAAISPLLFNRRCLYCLELLEGCCAHNASTQS